MSKRGFRFSVFGKGRSIQKSFGQIHEAIAATAEPGAQIHHWSPSAGDGPWAEVCQLLDVPNNRLNRLKIQKAWKGHVRSSPTEEDDTETEADVSNSPTHSESSEFGNTENQLIKEMMTDQIQEVKQTDREPEEKLEIIALFQNKRIPDNVLCGESSHGLQQLQDHLHIKKEEEEPWESPEVKQETDITAVTVKSEDEDEEAQCEENIKGVEPATCSDAKVLKVEPDGEEAANTDGEETDCSEDWREPVSQSEDQSQHMDMSCENFQTSENTNTEKLHGCDVCGKRFGTRTHLKVHMRIHTGEKPFGCNVCGNTFTTSSSLKNHMIIHTGEKPFGCDVCGKQWRLKTQLKLHMLIHSGEKPYECDVCQKRFITKREVNNHMRIHTGEKPFGCGVCGQSFTFKLSLSIHMSSHTGVKAFKCDVCEKGYNGKFQLEQHMRTHTGEKPFVCGICQKGFIQKNNLNRHIKIHRAGVTKRQTTRSGPRPTGGAMQSENLM